jgi:hypothetical protein
MPEITEVHPRVGPTSGGDVVRIEGTGFAPRVAVYFGSARAEVLDVFADATSSLAYVRTPAHEPGTVELRVANLDADGAPTEEGAPLPAAYRFERAHLDDESELTRAVRALLRLLKRDVLENTSLRVSVDYSGEGAPRPEPAALPALVLSGPRLPRNRFYGTNELRETVVMTATGPEIVRHQPPLTVDLAFTLKGSSNRVVELLNLMSAVGSFFARTKWLEMPRDAGSASELVRWEMDIGDFQTAIEGPDDLGEFTVDVVVRGFDIEPGVFADRGRLVADVEIGADSNGRLGSG